MKDKEKSLRPYIIAVSVAVPALVALLYFSREMNLGLNVGWIPKVNAIINTITAIMLLMGLMAIKSQIVILHKRFMTAALSLSGLFLLLYVLYHSNSDPTLYGDLDKNGALDAMEKENAGVGLMIYRIILGSHILLSIVILPLALITFVRGLAEKFDKHRKIARITLPIWLYVTISGVIVYAMISEYY